MGSEGGGIGGSGGVGAAASKRRSSGNLLASSRTSWGDSRKLPPSTERRPAREFLTPCATDSETIRTAKRLHDGASTQRASSHRSAFNSGKSRPTSCRPATLLRLSASRQNVTLTPYWL